MNKMTTFIGKKLLKDILMICDAYYKTKNLTLCLNSLYEIFYHRNCDELQLVFETEYNKCCIFPFMGVQVDETDFSPYNHVNKRMGFNMDWQCNIGTVLDCLQQLYVDFLKVNGGKNIEWLGDLLFEEK